MSASDLKYLEHFSNPYVKLNVSCKICNKEQSFKFQSNWRRHYLTHASAEEKPHNCVYCDKSFVQADKLKLHIKALHLKNQLLIQENIKLE